MSAKASRTTVGTASHFVDSMPQACCDSFDFSLNYLLEKPMKSDLKDFPRKVFSDRNMASIATI